MHIRKTIYPVLAALLLFASCKKDNSSNTKSGDDDQTCVQSASASSGNLIPDQYIVTYVPTVTTDLGRQDATVMRALSNDLLSRNNVSKNAALSNFSGSSPGFIAKLSSEEAERLKEDKSVALVEQDRIIAMSNCFTVAEPRLITWNVARVGYGDGTGKRAWIIDTGIEFDHPDLTVDASLSKSFLTGVTSAEDENGHGTHVAGIIGGKNNSIGVLGVASGATLISLRVLDKDGVGTLGAIVQALAYVNANATAGDVVNMSVGDDEGISESLDQQVKVTAAKGILIAIAAGNDNALANKYSPARANATNIYTVSAIDSLDNFASFSNYGNDVVDYATPGVRILSCYIGKRYAYMSGTSMAAPHMAGLLLLKGRNITTSGFAKNDPDGNADPIAHY